VKQQVWQLQDAKNRFSQVVEQAINQGPQIITRHGVESAIVISYDEYRRLILRQKRLSSFFRDSPLSGIALDLRRDEAGWRSDVDL
jgi:prevent-host-death family protein